MKSKIPNFKSVSKELRLPIDELLTIDKIISSAGGSVKLVGGNVRDLLLNKKMTSEPDLTTDLEPSEIVSCMKSENIKYIKTGYKYGTITVIINKNRFEITSLRRDIKPDGRWSKVSYTKDWLEDSKRRDFTINSIYCDLNGNLLDPHNGLLDLENKKVIFIGNPIDRINEDYLRILRFIRFSIKYSKSFDKKGLNACKKLKNKINTLSEDRRISELKKIVLLKSFEENFENIYDTGILDQIFNVKIYVKNINLFFSLERYFKIIDFQRRIKFFLRGINGSSENILINKIEKKFAVRVKFRIKLGNFGDYIINKNLFLHGKVFILDELIFSCVEGVLEEKRFRELLILVKNWKEKKLPISGDDLKILGLKEGVQIGKTIRKIEDWWIRNKFKPKRKECIKYINSLPLP